MSNMTNVCWHFSGIFLNQSITEEVFFHWFNKVLLHMLVVIFSSILLLTSPISLFAGLINLQVGLFLKFSLWSFDGMNACSFAIHSVLSSISSLVAIPFASSLMASKTFSSAFLYVDVILSCNSLSYCTLSSSCMFAVLSAEINAFGELLIVLMSFHNVLWNSSFAFLNLIFLIIPRRSSSNFSISWFWGGHFPDLKPNLLLGSSFSFCSSSLSLSKKKTFHRIRFITLPTFSINFFKHVSFDDIGIFFKE